MAKPSYYSKPNNTQANPGDVMSDFSTDVPKTIIDANPENTSTESTSPQVDISTPVVEPEVVVEPVVTPVVSSTPTADQSKPQTVTTDRNVQYALEEYLNKMAPGKPVNGIEGGKNQYGLWLTIKNILAANDSQDFKIKYNTLLAFANKQRKGVFSEGYLFRFPEHWAGSDNEFTNFRRVAHVVMNTCDNATRAASLKEINLEKAIEGLSEKEKTNVINFYGG